MDDKYFLNAPKSSTPQLPNTVLDCHHLILELFKRLEVLEIENRKLRECFNCNSSNSSLPPSRDRKKKKKKKSVSPNKSGGQPGHKGHFRELLNSEQVDVIVDCKLSERCSCGGEIKVKKDKQRHQVHELPEIKLYVTEYQLEKGYCLCCGKGSVASLPEGVTWGMTGPKLTGLMSHLVSKYQLSRRELKAFLSEHFNFTLSLGTVFNKQKMVNAALEAPVSALLETVKQSSHVHMDETSHNRDGKKQWMWCALSSAAAFFSILPSRGKKVVKSLMGGFEDIVISDRYAAYHYFDSSQRQLCWAHLKRDFTRLSEKEDSVIARIGKGLLACQSDLFKIWHSFKQNEITRDELLKQTYPLRRRIGELLEQGSYTDPTLKAAGFCKNVLTHFNALWTFLSTDNVEPTNNHAERALRHSVIWRKKYFGTRSDYGSEFVARSASLRVTCQLQSKNNFQALIQIIKNYFSKAPPSAHLNFT